MNWWRQARFGMFIHWGLYAVPAGTWKGATVPGDGAWIMNRGRIPVADYKAEAARFDPAQFDASAWVDLAKAAGMKYIVITAKHHDGFAMFKSDVSPFNIVDATPFKRDPLKELAVACEKQGIKLGFYYSQEQDWTTPGGSAIRGHWDKAQDGDFATYLRTKAIPQIRELLTNYQPSPAVIWFDTPSRGMTPKLASEIVALLNHYPALIWNNRLGGGYPGDMETPEQVIPPRGYPGKDWEACMTINGTWGYKAKPTRIKPTEMLLRDLIDIASKGGNDLLNVGPDATGVIPQPEADRLKEIGRWLSVNGEAIYGSGPSAFNELHGSFSATEVNSRGKPVFTPRWDWRCTTKPGKLFIHLFQWPSAPFLLSNVEAKITRAYLLADPKQTPLPFDQRGKEVTVTLPTQAPDPIASVLVLKTD